jgi:hypothetical protein
MRPIFNTSWAVAARLEAASALAAMPIKNCLFSI